jgi:hypothetical protein
MGEYLSPALAIFALGWALRLEAKSASMNRAIDDHDGADKVVHAGIADDLREIKGTNARVEGKLDQVLLKFIPQQVQGLPGGRS